MNSYDFCKHVDLFYGNGETDRFFDDGLASRWFYIKALCGNTVPHATLPFGKMSVGAYSGGYPTGYGTHYPNSCGGIKKLGDVHKVKGFSHLHQSGTGAIQYYYNYAVTTPFYGDDLSVIGEGVPVEDEQARPGYYKARLGSIACEMTVDGAVALHRYSFDKEGGRVAVDFSNNGLDKAFGAQYFSCVKDGKIEVNSANEISFSGEFSGVRLYFCVRAEGNGVTAKLFSSTAVTEMGSLSDLTAPYGCVFDFSGRSILLRVAYSTISADAARGELSASTVGFDGAAERAYSVWNKHLSAFRISTENPDLKEKFYSCLYHSLVKPADMLGESVLGVSGDTVSDFATFWDQYKTVFPLIYMCYSEMGERIVNGIVNISRSFGKIPCSFGLANVFPCEEQAKMLGIYALCDAHNMGYKNADSAVIDECMKRELCREDYKEFLRSGIFERYTHILDVTDACLCVAEITENEEFKNELIGLSRFWRGAYSDDALMSEKSPYYEGDRYTYSFRIQKNMSERVALAGGKEKFAEMLDKFFGFGCDSVKQLVYEGAYKEIAAARHHRFEGFNNECDMETPYAYIYADHHDRLAEIINECVNRSFGLGRSGLPGNNDSGGLSATLVFNALGIFPISGSGDFLIGSPCIDGAEIDLFNGKALTVSVSRASAERIYVDRVLWNGEEIKDFKISASELMRGGVLQFFMK